MNKKTQSVFHKAFRDSIPVMAGYIVLGIGFGMILKTNGFGIGCALSMSLLIYAGSMQFVAIPLLRQGASFLLLALTTLLVNARHLFYSISMVGRYRNAGRCKPYLIFALTDETYSLVCSDSGKPSGKSRFSYYLYVSVLDHLYWVSGSLIGALIGSIITFNTAGIDFALTALFLTILIDQWKSTDRHISAVIGFLVSAVCLAVFGADRFLLPAMVLITVALFAVRKREEDTSDES